MAVTVHIPTPLRPYVGGRAAVEAASGTIGEVLAQLSREHAPLRTHLFTDDGRVRSFVTVYVGDRNIRELDGDATRAIDGTEVFIVPSIAGGSAGARDR